MKNNDIRRSKSRYYEKLAQWAKEVGLVAVTMLVVQPIVSDTVPSTPIVISGLVVAACSYGVAHNLLKKSFL